MSRDLLGALAVWLAAGRRQMGEVLIEPGTNGFVLSHVRDVGREDLTAHSVAGEARRIALYAEDGAYRPLKTAPNLRRGWRLELATLAEVHQALDFFYPAMLGVLLDAERGRLPAVPLRGTLARQSGMYAVTRKLTDEQAQELIACVCPSATRCLKTILWTIAEGQPIQSLPAAKFDAAIPQTEPALAPTLPMLCHEACNILIAQAREAVKSAPV